MSLTDSGGELSCLQLAPPKKFPFLRLSLKIRNQRVLQKQKMFSLPSADVKKNKSRLNGGLFYELIIFLRPITNFFSAVYQLMKMGLPLKMPPKAGAQLS